MENLIGIQFKDFVLLAADKMNTFSIIVVKNDMNKIHKLTDRLVMGVTGEAGDQSQFAEYISKNIHLYEMRNGYSLSPTAAATYIQRNMAQYLRSRTPYFVNLLVAGYDTQSQRAELFFLDYLATMTKVPYAMHGYGGYFIAGLMDRIYKPNATLDEAVGMMRECIGEIQRRLVINLPNFQMCVVDKDGMRKLPDIRLKPIKLDRPDDLFSGEPQEQDGSMQVE